jgi:ABC-type Zn uptake system ZnuABC Zn-binding protein ZnuA
VTIGGELYADALGPVGSGAETYIGMMRANAATISKALTRVPTASAP